MTYNKKQMKPLIDKYGINPETNKLFASVIEMFDGQPNFQLWAVKMIFSKSMTIDELSEIKEWASKKHELVQLLEKKNIVAYSSKTLINQLKNEMRGLDNLSLIKNVISHFNTEQKKLLSADILKKEYTAIDAYRDANIKRWADIFTKFNKISSNKRRNFFSNCSSFRNVEEIKKAIVMCLEETYEWNKEDMLAYLENNTPDCEVVFNKDNIVIVRVPSYHSSQKLCGNGRTQWCITKQSSYFQDYVSKSEQRDQYFYFDFGRKETDAFAHIGFTTEKGRGIIYAQTCDNRDMMHEFKQGDETLNINKALENAGAKMSHFLRLNKNVGFSWDLDSIVNLVKENPQLYAIAYEGDNRVVINVLNYNGLPKLIGHTFVNCGQFNVNENQKTYVFMDFNLPFNDDKALIAMSYVKDMYGSLSLKQMSDTFNFNITKDGYLSKIGIESDSFLNREAIDPRVLLHKLIDERDEIGALKLIEEEGKNFDVNFDFNMKVPVFSAISNHMFNVFEAIINHPKFDCTMEDGFGESLLEGLLYLYGSDEINTTEKEESNLKKMIVTILKSKNFDYNTVDLNNDTAINIACEYPKMLWVVKALAEKRDVNINIVNDFDCAALGNCIRNKNIEALKIIGQRPDVKVRKEDLELAKSCGINLSEYIKPSEEVFKTNYLFEEESLINEMSMAVSN